MNKKSPPPLFKGSGGPAAACCKIRPIREKSQSALCMRLGVSYVPACLRVRAACVQVYTCRRKGLKVRSHVRARLCACSSPWIREEQGRTSAADGNKIKLFIGLEWERVAGATLGPLPIYFSIGVWECWTRLNRLALTKQHKVNTGDWGYNNTQQPLVLSSSPSLT